jgi:hypothetical protein
MRLDARIASGGGYHVAFDPTVASHTHMERDHTDTTSRHLCALSELLIIGCLSDVT